MEENTQTTEPAVNTETVSEPAIGNTDRTPKPIPGPTGGDLVKFQNVMPIGAPDRGIALPQEPGVHNEIKEVIPQNPSPVEEFMDQKSSEALGVPLMETGASAPSEAITEQVGINPVPPENEIVNKSSEVVNKSVNKLGGSKRRLTPKNLKFCKEYMKDLNGTAAATRAGYSRESAGAIASELLTKLEVKEEIDRLKKKIAEKSEVSAAFVISTLKSVVEVGSKTYKKDKKKLMIDAKNAVRAAELLGKHLGILADRTESRVHHTFEGVADQELDKKIEEEQSKFQK